MSKGKVLLTGHRGYIGSVMGPRLVKAGYDVVGLDTVYYGEDCSFTNEDDGITDIGLDIRDIKAENIQGFDTIIHLAALSNDPLGSLRDDLTYDINHYASVRLANMAKEAGASRFLFSSSCSMHGTSSAAKVDETTPVEPLTPYGESKIRSERDISKIAGDGFSPIFMRNGTVYGVSPRLRVDIVLNNLVGWAHTTGNVKLYTDGTPWRPLIHVDDVSDAFIAAMEAPVDKIHNEVFHVGSNKENYQIRQVAEIVQSVVPNCGLEFDTEHGGDQRTYIADFTKIETTLTNFKPAWTAETGARQLYEAYKRVNLTLEQFTGSRYIRLKRIEDLRQSGHLNDDLRWQPAAVQSTRGQ